MKRTLISIAAFAVVGIANATCPDGSMHEDHYYNDCSKALKNTGGTVNNNNNNNNTNTPQANAAALGVGLGLGLGVGTGGNSESNALGVGGEGGKSASESNATGGDAAQQQAQQQRAQADAKAASQANGTVKNTTATTTTQGVIVQGAQPGSGSNFTDKSRVLVLPPIMFAPGLAPMPGVNGAPIIGACGPRKAIYREPVYATMRNSVFPDRQQVIGWDEYTKDLPAGEKRFVFDEIEVDGKKQTLMWGHQVVMKKDYGAKASGSGFSIGGWGNSAGGQVGNSGQAQVQAYATSIELLDCLMNPAPQVVNNYTTYNTPAALPVVPAPGQ